MKTLLLTLGIASLSMAAQAQIPTAGLLEHFTFDGTLKGINNTNLAAAFGKMYGHANYVNNRSGNGNSAHSLDSAKNTFDSIPLVNFPSARAAARSVCFWFKHNKNTTHSFFNYNGRVNLKVSSFAMAYSANNIIFTSVEENVFTEKQLPLTYNEAWTHLAFVYGDGFIKIFVDGVLKLSEPIAVPSIPNGLARIGRSPGSQPFVDFTMDDLLLYNRVLTDAEVLQIAQWSPVTNAVQENKTAPVNVSVYPNPTNHTVSIQSNALVKDVAVFTSTGQQVLRSGFKGNSIDLSGLAAGAYILQIHTSSGIARKAIVKE